MINLKTLITCHNLKEKMISSFCLRLYFCYLLGSVGGGQTITFTGSGFDNTTMATICDKECVRIASASQTASELICVVPEASG